MSRRLRPEPTAQGTQRRLQALASQGWSARAIESATGIPAVGLAAVISGRRDAGPGLTTRVAAAYDLLWNQPPPQQTQRDEVLAGSARADAERHGWPPPMAWDDDIIDQPDGEPAPGWKPPALSYRKSADLVEDDEWVRAHDGYRQAPMAQVAMRLGVTQRALAKAHQRVRDRAADREPEAG